MHFNRRSIKWKILLSFFAIYMIAIAGVSVFYRLAMDSIRNTAEESLETILYQQKQAAYEKLQSVEEFTLLVSKDSDLQNVLRADVPVETADYYDQRLTYNARLLAMNQYNTSVQGCYVVGANGAFFKSSTISWLYDVDFWNEDWYLVAVETGSTVWLNHVDGSFMVNDLDAAMLTIVLPIQDRASTRMLGVVVTDILAEEVLTAAEEGTVFDGNLYLVNEANEIIYGNVNEPEDSSADSGAINQVLVNLDLTDEFTDEISIAGEKYLLSNRTLGIGDWKLIGLISFAELYEDLYAMRIVMVVVVMVASLFAILFALIALTRFTRPIFAMQKTMGQVSEGNLNARVEILTRDEIGVLGNHFNEMIDQVNALIVQEKEGLEKLRKAELNALQAQINPHFLYNALDSINWLARMKRNEEVIHMINALSGFYRISLSRGRTYITLKEEFKHAENYITIQRLRYKKLLNYEMELPEQLEECCCLKMVLQPLIENSIYHGIKEKGVAGTVKIRALECEGDVLIRVTDDGMGMEPEQLDKIRTLLEGDQEYASDAYGIINVQRRLKMYFGDAYGICVDSVYGEWTTVTVRLPKGDTGRKKGSESAPFICESGKTV